MKKLSLSLRPAVKRVVKLATKRVPKKVQLATMHKAFDAIRHNQVLDF